MTEKMYTPKKHTRYDKTGGVTDPCFYQGLIILIDDLGYSGSSLLELGIKTALGNHGLLKYAGCSNCAPLPQRDPIVDLKLTVGGDERKLSAATTAAAAAQSEVPAP